MSNTNYIEHLKKIVEEHHTQYGKFIRKPENKDLLYFINSFESDKLKDNNLKTKIYWILNDIHDYPKCHNPNCPHGVVVNYHDHEIGRGLLGSVHEVNFTKLLGC